MRRLVVVGFGLLVVSGVNAFPQLANAGPVAPLCFGEPATIVGTDGPDTIPGTSGDDVIVTLAGADIVTASTGSDRICAGGGSDQVSAGLEVGRKDYIDGGAGDDQLGGADVTLQVCPDTVSGTDPDGVNVIRAGGGDDIIAGSDGIDRVLGDDGNDCILGEDGNDRLLGAAGADYADGDLGNDLVNGGRGPDELTDAGSTGDTDSLLGHGGSDQLNVNDNDTLDTIDGGARIDTCTFDLVAPGDGDTVVNC